MLVEGYFGGDGRLFLEGEVFFRGGELQRELERERGDGEGKEEEGKMSN